MEAIILSDGKAGHLNQSLAICRLKGWNVTVVRVGYRYRFLKALSYLFDRMGWRLPLFWHDPLPSVCDVMLGTGSTTYYPLKVLSAFFPATTIAIMKPTGYRLEYDWIITMEHDQPLNGDHILTLPINPVLAPSLPTSVESRFCFEEGKSYIALIIGGPNALFSMRPEDLRPILEHLFRHGKDEIVVTTSRRTPLAIEQLLERYPFAYRHIYRLDPSNPIPQFLQYAHHVVITSDSTSMISEAVVGGTCAVDVVMLPSTKKGKFHRLIDKLVSLDAVHCFDGELGNANKKIDLSAYLDHLVVAKTRNPS